ncbi:TetR/AcrR family transcriptional regulator [Sphingomonas naphthae]|uniref:TetR/AcrR family transcriptional regulator n=1 Tax=Sphingomonas naphthae TaxID=1813468 RepID=A0ABY7TNF7_9SPHN|nr:TetR/AcrR family transcriptional regulator [Sphingomonas naphthae]WCT74202.1 TetR/AcrR family transcriptional regulator [Sphingomonas naphthae]
MGAMQHELPARARIVAAARHLFSTLGFHQTAMSELNAEANVSVGQIYRHFKGKADIILAIVQEDVDQRIAQMAQLRDQIDSGAITIEAGMTALCQLALDEENEALSFEILAEGHRNPDVRSTIGTLCLRYRRMLRDIAGAAHPGLSDAGLDASEELLLACMFGLGHRSLSEPRLSPGETARQTGRMLLGALRALT